MLFSWAADISISAGKDFWSSLFPLKSLLLSKNKHENTLNEPTVTGHDEEAPLIFHYSKEGKQWDATSLSAAGLLLLTRVLSPLLHPYLHPCVHFIHLSWTKMVNSLGAGTGSLLHMCRGPSSRGPWSLFGPVCKINNNVIIQIRPQKASLHDNELFILKGLNI